MNRNSVIIALVVAIACGVGGLFLLKRGAVREAASQAANTRGVSESPHATDWKQAGASSVAEPDVREALRPEEASTVPPGPPEAGVPKVGNSPNLNPPAVQAGQAQGQGDPPPEDPLARAALSLVGIDREAEAYWVDAINDSGLSAEERQNLIEDLNEDGLSDFRNPTVQDLPLILSRIRLIEELAPDAMDKVNADAFAEAHKDLVNMVIKITGGG